MFLPFFCAQVQYTQLDFLPTSPQSSSHSSSTQKSPQGHPFATKSQIQGLPGPRPRPSRGSPPPPIVEPYTNTTISTIMDLDEVAVEEHTRANTRLNTKTNSRKEKVLEQEESWVKKSPHTTSFVNDDTDIEEAEEEEEEEEAMRRNTRMDMRRQKDIAALAGIRCSQL